MLYCCGSRDEDSANGEKALLGSRSEGESASARAEQEMYGMSGIPDLLPPASSLQPATVREQAVGNGLSGQQSFDSPLRRQRAPKLGQIGRSKRVVIEDEDLDDAMNNNGQFTVALNFSPVN